MLMTMIMIIMPSHHLLSDDSRKRRSRVRGLSCLTTHNITSIIIVIIMNILMIILIIITIYISRKSSCLTPKTKILCIIDTIITIITIIIIVKASNIWFDGWYSLIQFNIKKILPQKNVLIASNKVLSRERLFICPKYIENNYFPCHIYLMLVLPQILSQNLYVGNHTLFCKCYETEN